jgi:hypothetical protein
MAAGERNELYIMSKIAKILVTVGVIVVFMIVFGAIVSIRTNAGYKTPGIIGLICFAALIGAIRAIWKGNKSKKDDNNEDNSAILQK